MDPVSLVVAAVVAGVAAGAGQTATEAVKDAYGLLKFKLRGLFGGDSAAEVVLAEHEADPDTYEAPLRKKLEAAGVAGLGENDDLLLAAHRVLAAADPEGARSGRYTVGSIKADRGGVAAAHIEGGVTAGYQEPPGATPDPQSPTG